VLVLFGYFVLATWRVCLWFNNIHWAIHKLHYFIHKLFCCCCCRAHSL